MSISSRIVLRVYLRAQDLPEARELFADGVVIYVVEIRNSAHNPFWMKLMTVTPAFLPGYYSKPWNTESVLLPSQFRGEVVATVVEIVSDTFPQNPLHQIRRTRKVEDGVLLMISVRAFDETPQMSATAMTPPGGNGQIFTDETQAADPGEYDFTVVVTLEISSAASQKLEGPIFHDHVSYSQGFNAFGNRDAKLVAISRPLIRQLRVATEQLMHEIANATPIIPRP